ncbi:Polynucleotide 5'-hydroxyl-kinase protein [Dioscorea alata]|uniref:Polynucleotide 5'-hydroxyl-kinase protein n=1 Tax=Dioscorea alata TaxID=55571 RepID=A0ACB7W3E3_DIOAL|nr:Polynucleotide 5'-hydroxyl-kinase protein [Dioscorea alata]
MLMGENDGAGSAPVIIPPSWEEAAEFIAREGDTAPPPIAVICGPKNSGKSTFSRYLLNTLLSRYKKVGYLDTDVGQPEFFLPGCLSVHIIDERISDLRSWSLKSPDRCCFFGDVSSKRDPQAYLGHVRGLYDYFLGEHYKFYEKQALPLIINTPGWVKGTGYDLLVEMLKYISPTHVVQVRISAERKNLPKGAFWLDGEHYGSLHLIDIYSARTDFFNQSVLTRKDAGTLRDRRLFEYFKLCFPSDLDIKTNKDLAYALASLCPYEVPFSRLKVKHLHCQVPNSEVFHSLNATIVGLAINSGKPPSSFSQQCVGLGIVRGIDIKNDRIYVITPVPIHNLQKVDLLLQGLIEIPTGFLQVRRCLSPYMATNVLHKLPEKDE